MDCAGVRQAAVTVERAARGVVLLHAYVRLDGDAAGDTRQAEQRLREHLAGRVPRYMMPSTLLVVDRPPDDAVGQEGKVNRPGWRPGRHPGRRRCRAPTSVTRRRTRRRRARCEI